MLLTAFVLLGVAVAAGSLLAVLAMRKEGALPPPLSLATVHGTVALVGLAALAIGLPGPVHAAAGTAQFGTMSAYLLLFAALLGATLFVAHLRGKRLSGFLIGMHATFAVGGVVVLAAYLFAA